MFSFRYNIDIPSSLEGIDEAKVLEDNKNIFTVMGKEGNTVVTMTSDKNTSDVTMISEEINPYARKSMIVENSFHLQLIGNNITYAAAIARLKFGDVWSKIQSLAKKWLKVLVVGKLLLILKGTMRVNLEKMMIIGIFIYIIEQEAIHFMVHL